MTVLSRRSYDDELGWVEALVLTHAVRSLSQHDLKGRIVKHGGEQPYEFICKRWTIEPKRFSLNPLQQMPGLNL